MNLPNKHFLITIFKCSKHHRQTILFGEFMFNLLTDHFWWLHLSSKFVFLSNNSYRKGVGGYGLQINPQSKVVSTLANLAHDHSYPLIAFGQR